MTTERKTQGFDFSQNKLLENRRKNSLDGSGPRLSAQIQQYIQAITQETRPGEAQAVSEEE